MRILDNGLVEIKNKKTGEVKNIDPQDLPNYGIPYSKYATELTAYKEIKGQKEPTAAAAASTKDKQDELSELEALATEILNLSKSGSNISGFGAGNIADIASNLGFNTPNVDKARSLASQLTAARSFGEGGKTFSETEKALLAGQVPQLDVRVAKGGWLGKILGAKRGSEGAIIDNEERLANKMLQMLDLVKRKRESLGGSKPSLSSFEE